MTPATPGPADTRTGIPADRAAPARAIERDYLAAPSEACPLDRWHKIVERAVADAEQGDAKARAWLGTYLAGKPTRETLRKIAVDELAGIDPLADSARRASVLGRLDPFRAIDPDDEDDEDPDDEDPDDEDPDDLDDETVVRRSRLDLGADPPPNRPLLRVTSRLSGRLPHRMP